MWLFLGAPPEGIEGLDWLWIVLAVILDLGNYGHTWGQRSTVEGGLGRTPGAPTA